MLLLLVPAPADAQDGETRDLAKTSQNPIGDVISLPLENNLDFGVGPEDALVYVMNAKPVYPLHLSDQVTLINRTTVPLIYQGERFEDEGSKFGLGDITYQAFFTPRQPGPVIWGVGPAIVLPSATDDRLGSEKWSAGPAFVALAKPGPWLFGTLVQNTWSFAGKSNRDSVNRFSLQYLVNYNFDSGWYLTSTPTIAADWEARRSDRWTVPFGGGVGKLVKIGGVPIDIKAQTFWNAEKPDGAATWAAQLQFKLLFPK
ncbi:MAG: neuromedin U [Pseudomonadota bacterium]